MSKAIQTVEPTAIVEAQQAAANNVLSVIERAALNPDIDIAKLQQLLDMQERIIARDAKAAYSAAFAAMQPDLPVIQERGSIKDRSGRVQSTYALWEDVNAAIKPVLAQHGFGLQFRTETLDGKVRVTGILRHRTGHSEETFIELPADTSGSKNAVQAIGSSYSYGKRYTSFALLNLSSTFSEDDDGQAGGNGGMITEEQVAELLDLIAETDSDIALFCKWMHVEAVNQIAHKDFERARDALTAKKNRGAA